MPPEWAASGGRLVLPNLDICFGGRLHEYGDSETAERMVSDLDDSPQSIDVLSMPKFVGIKGEETVTVQNGAYALKSYTADDDRWPAVALRFFLDFPSGAVRNDVTLPPERVFFTTKCWIDDRRAGGRDDGDGYVAGGNVDVGSFQTALDRLKQTKEEYRIVQEGIQQFDKMEQEEGEGKEDASLQQRTSPPATIAPNEGGGGSGNGNGIVGMFRRLTQVQSRFGLSEQRMVLRKRIDIFNRALPPLSSSSDDDGDDISNAVNQEDATIRTSNGMILMKDGYMSVKRYGGFMGGREEYHIVGKFTITDILDCA